jgi:hypothetical protein
MYSDPTKQYGPYTVNDGLKKGGNYIPHFLDCEFVGTHFMIEIYATFYSSTSFQLDHAYDLESLLWLGPFYKHPAASPLKFICSLTVELSFNLHPEDLDFKSGRTANILEFSASEEDFERQVEHLSELRKIEHSKGFLLTISISVILMSTSAKFSEALGPLAYDLKDKGVALRLNRIGGGVPRYSDLSASYDLPRAEWMEKTRKETAFVSLDQISSLKYIQVLTISQDLSRRK